MKNGISIICLMFFSLFLFSQQKMKVIKATSREYSVREENDTLKKSWSLNPKLKPDIYTVCKNKKPKWVTYYTDIDSIKFKVNPAEKVDFVILLNGKDSCFSRVQSNTFVEKRNSHKNIMHDTIPFVLTSHNNIKVKALLNGIDSLDLMFDTGASNLVVTQNNIVQKTHILPNREAILAGTEKINLRLANIYHSLQIGNLKWDSLTISPLLNTAHEVDGHFGWEIFDNKIVELDYDKKMMIVHSALPKISKEYSKLDIVYTYPLFCVKGMFEVKGKQTESVFLFDTGFQRSFLLDSLVAKKENVPTDAEVLYETKFTNHAGTVFKSKAIKTDKLVLGKYHLTNLPAQFMRAKSPAFCKTHVIGIEALMRFNTILDFQHNAVYLKPNSLINYPYKKAA